MIPGPSAPTTRIVEYETATGAIRGVYEFPTFEVSLIERQPREGGAFLEVKQPVDARTSLVIDGKVVPRPLIQG